MEEDSVKISGCWDRLQVEDGVSVVRVDDVVVHRLHRVHDNGDGTWTAEIPRDSMLARRATKGNFSDSSMQFSIRDGWRTAPLLCGLRPIDPLS